MRVTYQKGNGDVIQKFRKTSPPYKIGETTSMNWKVLNIEYECDNQYYSEYEYYTLLQKRQQLFFKKKTLVESSMKEIKTFLYYIIAVLIIKMLLGI